MIKDILVSLEDSDADGVKLTDRRLDVFTR